MTDQAEPSQRADTAGWIPLAIALSAVIQREVARIESADVIVLPRGLLPPAWAGGGYTLTPETERALARFKQTERGVYFSVYERR